jgi:hypothetical protein
MQDQRLDAAEQKRLKKRLYQRAYAAKYPDRVRASVAKYRAKNPDALREATERYYARRRALGLPRKEPHYNKKTYAYTELPARSGTRWSDQDIRRLFDLTVTDSQLCLELGRSRSAVETMRAKHKDMAPEGWVAKNLSVGRT